MANLPVFGAVALVVGGTGAGQRTDRSVRDMQNKISG